MGILAINSVSKSFGGLRAVKQCSFTVDEGQVVGLIGPNGAGKSTLIDLVCGGLHPDEGSIVFDGKEIAGKGRSEIARLGMIRTFQIARPLDQLPLMENLLMARRGQLGETLLRALLPPTWRKQEFELRQEAEQVLELTGLILRKDGYGGQLSGGQQKLLELARALMAKPKVLILDEPIAGVNPKLANEIARIVLQLKQRGTTVLVVEHNLNFVDRVSDKVVVMAEGSILIEGSFTDVRQDRRVVEAYIGGNPA